MNNNVLILTIFWGIWIIVPIVFDGLLTLLYVNTILFYEYYKKIFKTKKSKFASVNPGLLPKISIVIPTYNEEENIGECLTYLKSQNYPTEKIEIIVVDNGSTDATAQIVKGEMQNIWQEHDISENFKGTLKLIVREEKGKAEALNAGIIASTGEIIINIDCRAFLAQDAIYQMAAKFIENPEYGAATGNIEIDWSIIHRRDQEGRLILKNGQPVPRFLSNKEIFLAKAQFLEYLTSFFLGRWYQDITGSMYTFSGAFSAFKRDILLNSDMYSSRTVAEDTDLTLNLLGQNVRLGFAEKSKALLKPVISLERFYGQRVRWHRGQIEVIGLHLDWYGNLLKGFIRNISLSMLLIIDHTFGFPRIIWMFMLPMFFLFGYSMTLIIEAIFLMYLFYVLMDFLNTLNCYRVADGATKKKISQSIQFCFVTPIFRILSFYFRFAGYLDVLKEKPSWSTPHSPVHSTKTFLGKLYQGYNRISQNSFAKFLNLPPAPKFQYEEKIAEIDTYGLDTENRSDSI